MKNLKQLSAIALSAVFATMQISFADVNTGLGSGIGGAVFTDGGAGYVNMSGQGTNNVGLNFNANSHVKWDTLNVNKGETLNFNAVDGAKNLTILNSVNNNMSKIYGTINANEGIGNLILANPNGVLFNGANFTTAADTNVTVTTRNMSGVDVNNLTDGVYTKMRSSDWVQEGSSLTEDLIQVQLKDSNFSVGGDFNIFAPKIVGNASNVNANTLKLVTANGADYLTNIPAQNKGVTSLTAMNVNGDVVITNDVGALSVTNGGTINGNLTAETGGYIRVNETSGGNRLHVTKDVNLKGHGEQNIGNVVMSNDGGFIDMGSVNVKGNADLTTTGFEPIHSEHYNHFVHVIGETNVDGDLNVNSSQNIHFGNYEVTQMYPVYDGNLLDGKLTVGGDINAKTTGGHVMTTIDTSAKNINLEAKSYNDGTRVYGGNVLTDDKAVLSADTYQFKSDGYIGGMKATNGNTVDAQVIDLMENYTFIPANVESHDYMNVAGGTITKLETPKISPEGNNVKTYIKSTGDLIVNNANAGIVNLSAPDKQITITGDVHAKEINVDGRTGTLKLDFPNRDFTTNYTNIKDGVVKTIAPSDEITYELTNKPEVGYNSPDFKATDGTNTTYLVGPDAPDPGPTPPGPNPPGPNPPQPDPNPNQPTNNNDNAKLLHNNWAPADVTAPQAATPVAFAADLDDDDKGLPVRKNVDGSVTVVRAFPVMN